METAATFIFTYFLFKLNEIKEDTEWAAAIQGALLFECRTVSRQGAFADLFFLTKDLQIERHIFEISQGRMSATKVSTNSEAVIRNIIVL